MTSQQETISHHFFVTENITARTRLLRNFEKKKWKRNSLQGSHNISVLLLKGQLQEHFQEHNLWNVVVAICKEAPIRKYDIAG